MIVCGTASNRHAVRVQDPGVLAQRPVKSPVLAGLVVEAGDCECILELLFLIVFAGNRDDGLFDKAPVEHLDEQVVGRGPQPYVGVVGPKIAANCRVGGKI